ncbi:MAG TPA: phosphoglycerate dehydrogenase [Candidatus Acidoferrum sp.]|nr:phosphoglycerate dehydrogenase [Candidatus Acidoferrum sp.]
MSNKFRVLITDEMSPRAAELLSASTAIEVDVRFGLTAGDLKSVIADYDGLLVRSRSKATAEVIEAGKRLKIIGRAGIGVDNIDVAAASRRGIIVENAPSGNAVTTAEHALCLLLSLARHIPQATATMKAGKWEKNKFSGTEIMGKTLGVIGLGNIGRIAADRARGLKMKVLGYDPFIGREAAARFGVELVDLDELLARADFITIHTPLTNDTRGMIGAAALAKMKRGALLVNAARGGVVDEDALLAALESGQIGGAALDVFVEEPPRAGSALVAHPRLICTPHLGASTDEAQEKVAIEVAEQIAAFAERGEIRNAVNATAVAPEVRGQLAPWLDLCQRLGALVGQLAAARGAPGEAFIDKLAVEVIGEPAEQGATACTNATLVGLLRKFLDVPVNEINAPIIAADRAIDVSEVRRQRDRDLASAILVKATCGERIRLVKGTLYHVGDRVEARVVQIDDFLVEAAPHGTILVLQNQDRPGVIGAVGSALGTRGINVNSLYVGLDRNKGVALMLWCVDSPLDDEMVAQIRRLPLIDSAQVVKL